MPDPRRSSSVARARRAAQGDNAPQAGGYDADAKASAREATPVDIGGVSLRRRRKTWDVSRRLRFLGREQERYVAVGSRLRARIAELEAEQIEEASKGNVELEESLEDQIQALVDKADDGTEVAETATYRILALLLVPPAVSPVAAAKLGEEGDDGPPVKAEALEADVAAGFGVLDDEDGTDELAVAWLQGELDTEDAVGIAQELTGSTDPDPQTDPSSATGSS